MAELDDATVAYMVETRRSLENLRQVAAQLAGLLVLEASGAKSEVPHHPMLAAAEELYREAADHVRAAHATERARRHHYHLTAAAAAIQRALLAARQSLAVDPILSPLRDAYEHLRGAANETPGFEMVAFSHGCCALPERPLL